MESIRFRCPNPRCGKKLSAPESRVGKRGRCPKCGTVMRVLPGESEVIRLPEAERQPPRPQAVPPPPRPPFKIICPSCRTTLLVSPEAVGELISCPRCREFIVVPKREEVVGEEEPEELELVEEEPEKKEEEKKLPAFAEVGGKLELMPLEEAPREEMKEPAAEGPRPLWKRIFWPATATGWTVSITVHVGLLVLLALITVATIMKPEEALKAASVEVTGFKRTLEPELREEFGPTMKPSDVNVDTGPPAVAAELPIADVTELGLGKEAEGGGEATLPMLGVAGPFGYRGETGRITATALYGGTRASENAVEAGLRWLAKVQEPDGHWAVEKDGGQEAHSPAVSALSLLAFMGAGYTHERGRHAAVVKKGIDWLLSLQWQNGGFGSYMYNHGIATLALCEAYGMTMDERLKGPCERAVKFIIEAQEPGRGWRYAPRSGTDMSVTGWQLMALKSAMLAGLSVPKKPIDDAMAWMEGMSLPDGYVRYRDNEKPTAAMTAVGLLCRQLFGYGRYDALVKGPVRVIQTNPPVWSTETKGTTEGVNYYYWYYAMLAMFNYGGEAWESWNPKMRDLLLDHQMAGGGFDGSWDPVGEWCPPGERVYSTAMAVATLEVYYRYLPIYERPKGEFEKATEKSFFFGQDIFERSSEAWLRYLSLAERKRGGSVDAIEFREQAVEGFLDYVDWAKNKAELSGEQATGARILEAEANYRLGTLYYEKKELDRAEGYIRDFKARFPEYGDTEKIINLRALIGVARSDDSRLAGNIEAAKRYRGEALAPFMGPGAPEEVGFDIVVWGGDSYRTYDKDYRKALEFYELALSHYAKASVFEDRFPEVRLKMLECYVRLEDWSSAMSLGQALGKQSFRGTELGNAAFGLFARIGDRLYLEVGNPREASGYYVAALRQLRPGADRAQELSVKVKLGSCYSASAEWAKAVEIYEGLTKDFPGSAELARDLARAYKGAGKYDKAVEKFVELQGMEKRGSAEWVQTRYEIAETHALAREYDLSLASIDLTRELYPTLGGAELRAKFEKVEQDAKRALGK